MMRQLIVHFEQQEKTIYSLLWRVDTLKVQNRAYASLFLNGTSDSLNISPSSYLFKLDVDSGDSASVPLVDLSFHLIFVIIILIFKSRKYHFDADC